MDDTSSSRDAVLEAARLIEAHKGEDTVVLDTASVCSFADFFIISTARSRTHLAGLHRELQAFLRVRGIRPLNSGHKSHGGESGWLLLDCGTFVIHLMEREQRGFYDLERLWFKAERVTYWSKSS
jgi:ribosome-associated protein